MLKSALTYLAALPPSRIVLWCYLIWYLVTASLRFDPSLALWLNSLGISAVIGFGLLMSVSGPAGRPRGWPLFRLFAMPFAVSSFSSLIKGHGYFVVFPPSLDELLLHAGACGAFLIFIVILKRYAPAEGTPT